jgi:Fe2+ or Zn2+ uptake regulation protein
MKTTRRSENREYLLGIFQKNHLLSAKDLIEMVSKTMDRATVYRNLKTLVDSGILKEIKLDKEHVSYELTSEEHQHFKCLNCHKIIPVEIDEKAILSNLKKQNLEPVVLEMNISGYCEECNSINN